MTTKGFQQDIDLSYSVMTLLYAVYDGRYAYQNVLSVLNSPLFRSGDFVMTRNTLEMISQWVRDLNENKPIFMRSWREPESPEAKRAFELIDAIKVEIADNADRSETILKRSDISSDLDRAKQLVAFYGRYAYTRRSFLIAQLHYLTRMQKGQQAQICANLIESANQEVSMVDEAVAIFNQEERPSAEFFAILKEECVGLPGALRATIHDLNQLLATYLKEFTYDHAEIAPLAQEGFRRLKLNPQDAGYWQAQSLGPEATELWLQVGITDPVLAGSFRNYNFSPGQAALWLNAGFSPVAAHRWRAAGYTSETAVEAIQNETPIPGPVIPGKGKGEVL